jgi:ubiquinone/menaquinone biosynthesis C-methylase UbiE
MELIRDVREISRIGYGFMAAKALFAALDLDLFTRIARAPSTTELLSTDIRVPPKRLGMLLSALRALGLVGLDSAGRLVNSPAANTFLSTLSPKYYGDYFRFQIDRQVYPSWGHFLPAIRGEHFQPFYQQMSDPIEARNFSVAQHAGSLGAAHLLARRIGPVSWQSLLDVAGGTGAFSITLCQRNRHLKATILDFPNVCDVAHGYVKEVALGDRIGLLPGDARSTNWPGEQDAILMSYLLSAVSDNDIEKILSRAFHSLAPGGIMIIHDFMVLDDLSGPALAALWLLSNVIADPDAPQLTPTMLVEAATKSGFRDTAEFELLPGITRVVTAVKPAA